MSLNSQLLEQVISQGKTQWLREYLSENLPALNLPDANYQAWFDDFIQFLKSKGLSQPSQQKNRITDVRNAIKVLDPNHPALDVIKFSRETWVKINEADRDRIAERSTKLIDNPDAIVNTAIELIKTNNWSDIAAGLAVLTGRRCGEIIKTAQFEYKTAHSVTFKGALKRGSEPVELVFEIPTLCQADLIIKAIDCLRLQLGDEVRSLSIGQINQRYEERVANKCDRHFSYLVPPRDGKDKLYSHLFRAVYATIACYWYCPPSVPEMEFRAAIQGHYKLLKEKNDDLRRSLAASRHYFDYKIDNGLGNIDGKLGIKLSLPRVKVIEQFQARFKELADHHEQNQVKTTSVKSSSKSKSIMNTNQQSNSLSDAVVSLQLSLSRLETISSLLNLPPAATINTLVDWAEAGASLARHLEIDNPTPEALSDHVKELEQNYVFLSSNTKSLPSETTTHTQPGSMSNDEQKRLLISVASLSNSVEFLTRALVEGKSYSTDFSQSDREPVANRHPKHERQLKDHDRPDVYSHNLTKIMQSKETSNSQKKPRKTSSENRGRDSSKVMIQDINNAIDAVMKFNDAPGRPHKQKFRINIQTLYDLTNRAKNSISKVLSERNEEIESHHERHQLDAYHNKSRKDEQGNFYLPIKSETEIDYQKLTERDLISLYPLSSSSP
ncbi:MAG: hypothetical protein HC939_23445 [Pleurocapsa sp. SU_5_0]|nr:hypothetical protein [Pleurocapsa sp. SU_5_0]NJO98874.1 hypothetical protein [Pleurocapsa sp. CRU_1_2]